MKSGFLFLLACLLWSSVDISVCASAVSHVPQSKKSLVSIPKNGAELHKGMVLKQLAAGGIGRSLAQMALYPVDALRTLAQTRDGRTLADVGVSSLLRGCTTTSSFALFIGSIQFAVYEGCRNQVGPLLASAAGAVSSCVVSVPQEVIKQRLVTGVYSSFREAVSTIYSTEGFFGFYNAWKPTMVRNVPFVMTTFVTMDFLKKRRLQSTRREDLNLAENLVVGVSSALVGGFLTQPVDVIKTRMMTQSASMQLPYKSAIDCLASIVKTEGPLTLYAGLKQRSIYMGSLWGITFAINGQVKAYLMKRETEK